MKKLVSLLLSVCACLSVGGMTTACDGEEHTHAYKTEWSKDSAHHWHECKNETCLEVSDKAEHAWNDGTITIEATASANGEKTYTCTVCNATKNESFAFVGISEEKWNTAIQLSNFDNVTFAMAGKFVNGPTENSDEDSFSYLCKIDGNSATMNDSALDGATVASLKSVYINTAVAIVNDFANFTYDKDSKTYKSNQDIVYTVTVMEYEATITAKNVSVTVDDNANIASIACTMLQDFKENGTPKRYTLDISFTYSNYGTTVVN